MYVGIAIKKDILAEIVIKEEMIFNKEHHQIIVPLEQKHIITIIEHPEGIHWKINIEIRGMNKADTIKI